MSRVSSELNAQYWEPDAVGPVAQLDLSKVWATPSAPLAPIAAGTPFNQLQYADGFKSVSAGVLMDQAGTIALQRYLDEAGQIPQGPAVQANVAAGTPAVVTVADNLPFASIRLTIAATGGVPANVGAFAWLFNAT